MEAGSRNSRGVVSKRQSARVDEEPRWRTNREPSGEPRISIEEPRKRTRMQNQSRKPSKAPRCDRKGRGKVGRRQSAKMELEEKMKYRVR